MKIAIVGSGISGLTCGYMLSKNHEVHLFESESRLGGHTHTHAVKVNSGEYLIDTGFIVCNNKNYPNFFKLIDQIDIKLKKSFMSFSVKDEKSKLEYNGTTLNSLFCQRRNFLSPKFYRMIKDILRFNKEATEYYIYNQSNLNSDITLEEYLKNNNYSSEFIEFYIMPMGAAIWSASREEMTKFPLNFFVRFFHHHGMLTVDDRPQWYVLEGGSSSYIPKLTSKFQNNIHLSSPVQAVERIGNQVRLVSNNGEYLFDEVIFATHGDQTRKILKNPTPQEKAILGNFDYRPNEITLHTDTNVLPKSKLGHASWNYFLPKKVQNNVAVTYHMNILQGINSPETFLVSLNMDDFIDQKKVIKKISYSHPVYTLESVAAQAQWDQISGVDHIHYCGAYWGNGFHEDGVKSALKVCKMFGAEL